MKSKLIIAMVFFLGLMTLWELSSRLIDSLIFVLPAPSYVLANILQHQDRFLLHTLATFKEMLGGFVAAFLLAFPLGWLMYSWKTPRLLLQPLFVMIQCIPIFTLAPLMVLWFGWSYTAIVVPTALMIFFPLTLNIYQGLKSTPQSLIDYFKVNGATRWQTFYKLQLPWITPYLFAGFRISAGVAGIGAIAAEWAGAQNGLGVLMLESRRAADFETTFGALFCLVALSLSLYGSIAISEKLLQRSFRWCTAPAVALLTVICLASCQPETSHSKETRLILDWLPNPDHVPFYAGVEQGIFAKYGIDLKIIKVNDPGDALPYLLSGQTELAITYMPHTLSAIEQGTPIEVAAVLIKEPLNCFLFRKMDGIVSLEDLSGKVIGYCTDGYDTAFLKVLLAKNLIKPKELRNVSFDLVTTVATKQVDAVYGTCWNIESALLRSQGIESGYFSLAQFGVPDYYELIIVAKKDFSKSHPVLADHFKKALQESIDFAKSNPEEAFKMYLKANPDKSEKTRQWELEAWYNTIPALVESQVLDTELWNRFAAWMRENDLMH